MFPHITIDEVNSLSESEADMLLYICNIWAPIKLPPATEQDPHPITLNLIRYGKRNAILDRIKQSESVIKEEYKEIYIGIKTKFGMVIDELKKTEPASEPTTGSIA